MSTTFDKLAYLETLKAAGVPDDQARAHTHALDAAFRESVATKGDIEGLRLEVEKAKLDVLRWMIGLALAQIGLLVGVLLKISN